MEKASLLLPTLHVASFPSSVWTDLILHSDDTWPPQQLPEKGESITKHRDCEAIYGQRTVMFLFHFEGPNMRIITDLTDISSYLHLFYLKEINQTNVFQRYAEDESVILACS